MLQTPHKNKLEAAYDNPKFHADQSLLKNMQTEYYTWVQSMNALNTQGKERVLDLTRLLNAYKDFLEVDAIAAKGSELLKRQKGQLKLDSSVMEEFLVHLIDERTLTDMASLDVEWGSHTAFMTLAFRPSSVKSLCAKPEIVIKAKDQDFALGKTLHYQVSPDATFAEGITARGEIFLSVLSAEMKVNLDKTMFQECCGTASRLKQGCPSAKYFVLAEFLDMEPEDVRLTDIDNVFLLRHAHRLPSHKRNDLEEIRAQHKTHPLDGEILYRFVQQVEAVLKATWYDPTQVLTRGSFL